MLSDEATRGDDPAATSRLRDMAWTRRVATPLSRARENLERHWPRTNKQIFLEFAPGSLVCVWFAQGEVRQRTNPFAVVYGWFTGFGGWIRPGKPMPAEFA